MLISFLQVVHDKLSLALDLLNKEATFSKDKANRLKQKLFTYRAEASNAMERFLAAENDASEAIR